MKLYKFFKIPKNNEKDDVDLENKYILYAITNNKEMAERFKKDRNMKKFILKVHEGITKEEYANICNNYETRSSVLEYHELLTVFNGNHTKENSVTAKVLMTNWEYQLTNDVDVFNENIWTNMPYPLIFKKKYIKALEVLEYISLFKLFMIEHIPYDLIEKINESINDDDYSAPAFVNDEVAIFIKHIKDTL